MFREDSHSLDHTKGQVEIVNKIHRFNLFWGCHELMFSQNPHGIQITEGYGLNHLKAFRVNQFEMKENGYLGLVDNFRYLCRYTASNDSRHETRILHYIK